jgi:alkylhydroperoxidase family enzyme/3-phenylpropionate/cinnamic acid dioxygenase small subunit
MLDDRTAIEHLILTYAERVDHGDFEAAAALFDHASWRAALKGGINVDQHGADAVLEGFVKLAKRYPDGTPRTKHVTTNMMIELDGDRASSRSYYLILQETEGFPLQVITAGRYHDRFEKVDGSWRFADRLAIPDLQGDLSHHRISDSAGREEAMTDTKFSSRGPARLAPLRKVDLVGEQAELYQALVGKSVGRDESFVLDEQGAVKGPIAVLLRHPSSGRPLQELAATLRFAGLLPNAAREAVILTVAAHWRDAHEWGAHEIIARKEGMSDEQLALLKAGAQVSFDDPVTQAAVDAAHGIVKHGDLSDEEYARVQEVLGDEQLVELTVIIGYYSLLSMQLRVFRVPSHE